MRIQSASRWRIALGISLSALVLTTILAPQGMAPTPVSASTPPTVAGCPTLPANNVWNARVDALPVHARSSDYLASMGLSTGLHADFGAGIWDGGPIGIPYTTVPGTQPGVAVSFDYADESDPGPYPIPANAPIEGGAGSSGDRHVLVVDRDHCVLYELYSAYPNADGSWHAGSGAIYPLNSNALRPAGWTSADAAGLPILPGLARYDEVAAGEIAHALRFTASVTQKAYLWPARHYASSNTSLTRPPMGTRVRLKASFDISGFSPTNRVLLQAMKTYGMILADNGSNWYVSGAPDSHWNDSDLHALASVVGNSFEVVDESSLMIQPNSGQAQQSGSTGSTPTPPGTPTLPVTTTPPSTGTPSPFATSTSTPTRSPTPSPTRTSVVTSTRTPTSTALPPSATATQTRSATATRTSSATATQPTPTATPRHRHR